MIKSFADSATRDLHEGRKVHRQHRAIARRARLKLRLLDNANDLLDLRAPPANQLKKLLGDRRGQWSIRINDQYRICFKWEDGNALDVEITDYH